MLLVQSGDKHYSISIPIIRTWYNLDHSPEGFNFLNSLALYGGVLNLTEIEAIYSHIEENSKHLFANQRLIENAVSTLSSYNNLSEAQVMVMAQSDAVDILKTAIDRHE